MTLSPGEIAECARASASCLIRAEEHDSEAESLKEAAKQQTKNADAARQDALQHSLSVHRGYDYRDVDVELRLFPQEGVVRVIRVDTGEAVRERPPLPEEAQLKLFQVPEPAPFEPEEENEGPPEDELADETPA